jgi:hypothetical protein
MMDQRTPSRPGADLFLLPVSDRNYGPKTGKELVTAANIITLCPFLMMKRATTRYGSSGL